MSRPSSVQPVQQRALRYSSYFAPFGEGSSVAAMLYNPVVPFVPPLLSRGRPSAVLWFVSSVIVDAVKSMSLGWGFAHVLKKITEIKPSVANIDSPTRVFFIADMSRVAAPLDHHLPDRELPRACLAMLCHLFKPKASAGLRGSGIKGISKDHRGLTAIAVAYPAWRFAFVFAARRSGDNNKASESLSSKIDERWHSENLLDGFVVDYNHCKSGLV